MRAIAPAFQMPWLAAARTPARATLADHQQKIDDAETLALELKVPVDRAAEIVAAADAAVREATAAIGALNDAELAELVETAKSGADPLRSKTQRARATAEQHRLECLRRAELSRQALLELTAPYDAAVQTSIELQAELPRLVIAVMAEHHADALARYSANLLAFQAAELELRSIVAAVAQEERQLRDGGMTIAANAGAMAQAIAEAPAYDPPSPAALHDATLKTTALMDRLAGDADAQLGRGQ